jgi:site-specific DNA-methyltransferase (adenine-specific)
VVINTFKDGKRFWGINNDENMTIDAIIGNPPYQVMDGGNSASAMPVYQHFVNLAKMLNPHVISMIMPSRWLIGGRGLDAFRNDMLHDDRICVLHDFFDAKECFPTVGFRGGVCYFLWNKDYHGCCNITSHREGNSITQIRPLLEEGSDTFIRSEEQISILYKVKSHNEDSISKWLSAGRFFGFHTKIEWNTDNPSIGALQTADGSDMIPVHSERENSDDVMVYVHGGTCWINRTSIPKNVQYVDSYKVLLPRSGNPDTVIIGKPKISEPGTCNSNTYVVAMPLDRQLSKDEAYNLFGYMKTKFFRFLVATKTTTQSMSLPAYSYVPLQDFHVTWTDDKLYSKYALSDNEINFIESMIKPME